MKNVSQLFKDAVKRIDIPREVQGKIEFSITEKVGEYSVVNSPTIGFVEQLFNEVSYGSDWITLEPGRFKLDGSMHVPDYNSRYEYGYISESISDVLGAINTELDIIFIKQYTSYGLTIYFQEPVYDFTITLDETTVYTFTNNQDLIFRIEDELTYSHLKINITKVEPQRRVRILQVYLGTIIQIEDDEIVSMDLIDEISLINDAVPSNGLDLSIINTDKKYDLLNPTGIYQYFKQNQVIKPYLGVKYGNQFEFVQMGKFYLRNWSTKKLEAKFEALSYVDILEDEPYRFGRFETRTLYDMLDELLADVEHEIDASLSQINVNGYIPLVSKREALKLMLQAGNCLLRTDEKGKIIIAKHESLVLRNSYLNYSGQYKAGEISTERSNQEKNIYIDADNSYEYPTLEQQKPYSSVEITVNNYEVGTELATLFTGYVKGDGVYLESRTGKEFQITEIAEPSTIDITKIEGASYQNVTVQGKNICPTDFSEWESGHYDSNGIQAVTVNRIRIRRLIKVLPSTTYYADVNENDTKFTWSFAIRTYKSDGTFTRTATIINPAVFTTTADETFISITIWEANSLSTYSDYQSAFNMGTLKPFICLNSESDKTYEPFTPNSPSPEYPSPIVSANNFDVVASNGTDENRITIPYTLRSLPNGVKDTIEYIGNGKAKLIKIVETKVFDGSADESWLLAPSSINPNSKRFYIVDQFIKSTTGSDDKTILCNQFKALSWNDIYLHDTVTANGISTYDISGRVVIRIETSRLTTQDVTGFKTWLSQNPVTVQYELATPIITEISLPQLQSYKGVTNVYTTAELKVNMEVKFPRWSKVWIEYAESPATNISITGVITYEAYAHGCYVYVNVDTVITVTGKLVTRTINNYIRKKYSFNNPYYIDNSLIIDEVTASKMVDFILSEYSLKSSVPYRGYIYLDPGDMVIMETEYGDHPFYITKQTFEYEGYLKGSMEGAGVSG